MKSLHFFIGVFTFNFIFSMNIISADSENQKSTQKNTKLQISFISNYSESQESLQDHRVTPLSPKKTNKDCSVTPFNKVSQDHRVTPLDHGTTPVKEHSDLDSSKENRNPSELVRTESMSLRYSYSNNTFASCNSFADLYALAAANATPSSPLKHNGSFKGRASLFPSHCNTHQEGSNTQR
jgi:hypothetical protein